MTRPKFSNGGLSGAPGSLAGRVAVRTVSSITAVAVFASTLFGPLSPVYGQVITDPKAAIVFRPGITSSANGTPTVNIVAPSRGGVSHNRYRQYDIDTRGLILNNSGLGGTSIIGGVVARNPNLEAGGEARIILNEVTGTRRSTLNGVTEVFGRKADVIVANPNGIGCVGCGFINTGAATLTTGVPVVDYDAGTVGLETRKGDITVSGAGVSAPAGQMPDRLKLIGRTLQIDGLVEAKGKASLTAGATRIDPETGVVSRIADAAPSGNISAIVSNATGVIRAASIEVLSTDLDTGIALSGNLQALGSYDADGKFAPGDLAIVSAGKLRLVAGEASGKARVQAAGPFQLARDLSAAGEIAITAQDIALLDGAGIHAGRDLKIVAQADIVSGAVLKSGGALTASAGGDAAFTGLIAAVDGLDFDAKDTLATDRTTLIAPKIDLGARTVDLTQTWVVPAEAATIAGVDVTLGKDTVLDPKIDTSIEAARRLTVGFTLDTVQFPHLSLAYRDLAISETGAFVSDDHAIDAGAIDNAGTLLARGNAALTADTITNRATGVIEADAIDIRTSGDLTNLGQILSASTLAVLSDGKVLNDGTIGADGMLTLQALSYSANAPEAELVAARAEFMLGEGFSNQGALLSRSGLDITAGGQLSNAGTIRAGANLNLGVADLINLGAGALIDSNAALTIRAAGAIDNRLGGIFATGGLDLVAGAALANSGLLYSDAGASILADGFDNRAGGQLHADTLRVDLGGGDLANLGEIVSADTLDVIRAGDVVNDGIVQAGGRLILEARSYTANAADAELVAQKADLMLGGVLKNAGLIAVASGLGLDVGEDLSNAASGEIAANTLEAKAAGDLTNLGKLLSQQTLQATVGGVLSNAGAIRSGGNLDLSAAGLLNSGAEAVIDSNAALTIRSAGMIDNDRGGIFATGGLDLVAGAALANSGLLYSDAGASILADGFDNRAGGQLHADTLRVDLGGGDLANLGEIVSADTLDVIRAGDVVNDGIVQAGGRLILEARSYTANAAGAGLVAQSADLSLDGALQNAGLIATVGGDLGLDAGGNVVNTSSGAIASAAALRLDGADAVINNGIVKAAGTLRLDGLSYAAGNAEAALVASTIDLVVNGALLNAGLVRTLDGDLNLSATDLVNTGAAAAIDSSADLVVRAGGSIDNSQGRLLASGSLDLVAGAMLANSGLLYSEADASVKAGGFDNRAGGQLYADTLHVDLGGGDLYNLGEIVSADTLDVIRAGDVVNDGIVQAGGRLTLDALSYTANAPEAELVAQKADLILDGALKNAGLIAVAGDLGLDVGQNLSNAASGEIVARTLEARVAGDLGNLGRLLSEQTLQATVTGLAFNGGDIRSGGDLNLTVADLVNSGAQARIAGNQNVAVTSARDIDNSSGSIAAGNALLLATAAAFTNSGLLESGNDLSLAARTLDNQAGGRIHAGSIESGAPLDDGSVGILHTGSLTISLSGNLANLGGIVSANTLTITSGGTVNNNGGIEAGGDLRLEAYAYVPGSPAAKLVAQNLDLILGSSFTNSGLLSVVGRLGLDIDGSLTNTQTGRIEAGAIEMAIAQNLTNLGSIVSEGTLQALVAGLLTNEGTIRAGGAVTLEAGSLVNRGEDALIGAGGDLAIRVAGNLDNLLGRILTEASLGIGAGGTLTNASARIESGADMAIAAATVINTAIAGTDGGTVDLHNLGRLTVDYSYDHDDGFSDKDETWVSAIQDEFSGTIALDRPGVIRAGSDLILESDTLHNENGRILAEGDLSIDTRILVNDAQTFVVDHYKNEWGHYTEDDHLPFTAPAGGGWSVHAWTPDVLTEAAFDAILDGLPRRTVTYTELQPTDPDNPGAVYMFNGPNGPGYYVSVPTTTGEEVVVGTRRVREQVDNGGDGGPRWVYRDEPISYPEEYLRTAEGRMVVFDTIGSLLIATGDTPVSVRGSDDVSQSEAEAHARLKVLDNANPAEFLNLAALGIDPNDVPATIVISNRIADLGSEPYSYKGRTLVGQATVAHGSVIKAGGALLIASETTANRGTLAGSLVSIEGGTLDNGIGAIDDVDGSGPGRFDGSDLGDVAAAGGSNLASLDPLRSGIGTVDVSVLGRLDPERWGAGATAGSGLGSLDPSRGSVAASRGSGVGLLGGGAGIVDFVLDDVAVPPLDLGAFNTRNLVSLDPNDFGNLQKLTGSLEAARLLAGAGSITGSTLAFYADPVQEAKALAEAALRATGSHLVIDPSLSAEEQREELYRNAAEFAALTGAKYGVALTEAQRAALTKPIVWHETRIVDGKPVLVPRLYLPSSDELLRGGRGPGLIAADDLLVDLSGRLANTGTLAASGLASISASSLINQRMLDLDSRERAYAGGRGDTGLISAGTLLMTTDGDLLNRGGTIAAAGSLDLRIGGDVLNLTQRYTRAVDSFDLCMGSACGGEAIDYNVARITAGRDLTIIAGGNLINRGGELGSVTDMLLAAGGDVRFETLKDSFLAKDYHQRGFLSGTDIVEHSIVTAEATAQSLVGDVSILAGYGLCDGGALCAGDKKADAVLNGALISAYGNVSIDATGGIDMGTVSEEIHDTYKEWGFSGLGWGKVKQNWNDVSTSVTRISGDNVTLSATGPITGTGTKIAAASDLLMMTDADIRFQAAQDARYFTEKGFYIGLTFPGSAGINAALQGGSGAEVLTGLADINPLTRTLAQLANADNGLAAGLAAVNLVTRGFGVFGGAVDQTLGPDQGGLLGKALNPLSQFTDENGNVSLDNFGISFSSWKSEQRWTESQMAELVAGGDVVMKAGLDVILDQGTSLIGGEDVSIDAGRDIVMAALVDYARDKSSSFGLSISLGGSIGFDIAKSQGYDEVLTNASIAAGGDVSLQSGRDTALLGGNIAGRAVDLDVGRDLTMLSPQAEGWRDGYSFGLTVGINPLSLGIRGSSEEGSKAWSSGSSIVAVDGIDIEVAEDTVLNAALLNATDGDIDLETETLTVSDNRDHDQYKNVGGSIGLNGSGLSSIGFHHEEKDKQGETRTTLDAAGDLNVTIHDADKDGVRDTAADKAAAGEQIAALNKDAANWQEITRDEYTKLSGELDVAALRDLKQNIDRVNNYSRAQNAAIPDTIAAQGPEAVDLYRDAIVRGLSGAELDAYVNSDAFADQLRKRSNLSEATKAGALSREQLAQALYLTAAGEQLYFDEGSQQLKVVADCGTYGYGSTPCGVPLNELSSLSKQKVDKFIEGSLASLLNTGDLGDEAGLKAALDCAVAWTIQGGSFDAFETIGIYLAQNRGAISETDRKRAEVYLAVARTNAEQIDSAVDNGLVRNLNDEDVNWGSQLYDIAALAQSNPDAAWTTIANLQYTLLTLDLGSELGANTWVRMKPALEQLARSLDMGDALTAGNQRFAQMSEDQRIRASRGIQAWIANDGSFEKLPAADQQAAIDALGTGITGMATGPGAAIGAVIGGAIGSAAKKLLTLPAPNSTTLTQKGLEHIVERHWPTSGAQSAGKFAQGTTARSLLDMIKVAVGSGAVRNNTRGRAGQIYEYDFVSKIGTDIGGSATSRLRVVVSPTGEVVTAFPY